MAYNSIKNHNWFPLAMEVSWTDYWDFQLADTKLSSDYNFGLVKDCLISYIDTRDEECVDGNNLLSKGGYKWDKSVNKGLRLEHIGITGMDNGLIKFDMETVTDKEFEELFSHSVTDIPEGDTRLRINSVAGNNGRFYYGNSFMRMGDENVARLNGGFFQGFFRTGDGCEYNVLPSILDTSWGFEVTLRRCDFENESGLPRMNDVYPDNKGIFLYIGTRAENKWWRYYNDDTDNKETSDMILYGPGMEMVSEFETDNKFLIFDRTKDGLTVYDTEEGEDISAIITMPEGELKENPFLVYHRGKGGCCVYDDIPDSMFEGREYDIESDLYNNALAFKVKDDGSVGYQYLVRDCESEDRKHKIESEFSKPGMVPYDEWAVIHIRVDSNTPYPSKSYNATDMSGLRMRIRIYVNGRLVFVSRELEGLRLRNLYDLEERQEGVAFNISVGGGTQGLSDVVYQDYKEKFYKTLPLEESFGGSFSGYIRSFKFYDCGLTFDRIRSNAIFEIGKTRKGKI